MPSFTQIIVLLVVLFLFAVLAVGGLIWWNSHSATNLAAKEQTVAGQATVAAAQSNAAQQAQQIVVTGGARDQLDIQVHQQATAAIQAAAGANVALDPALNAAGIRGLCLHSSYATDPGCAGLHSASATQLPPTSPTNSAP